MIDTIKKNIFIFILMAGLIAAQMIPMIGRTVFAQNADCSTFPSMKATDNVPTTGSYRIWILAKKESNTVKPYLRVDSGRCHEYELPSGAGWEWLKGANNDVSENLSAGMHDFNISANGGAILVDKILVTNNVGCTPTGDGNNCLEEKLDFELSGVSSGPISGSRFVQVNIFTPLKTTANVEFFVDGVLQSSRTAAPYCMVVTAEQCAEFNFNTLGNGEHTLTAKVSGNELVAEKEALLTVVQPAQLPPAPESDQPSTGEFLNIQMEGIAAGDVVSGSRAIKANITGTTKPIYVRFKINHEIMAERVTAPYCFVNGSSGQCGEWDSSSVPNGKHTMYVIATAEGFKDSWATMPIEIKNSTPLVPSSTGTREIVVGKTNQRVSGSVKAFLPDKKRKSGSRVVYKIDKKIVAQTTTGSSASVAEQVSAIFDTSEFTNGTHVLSAATIQQDGNTEVVQSEIQIKNDLSTAVNNWLRQNVVYTVAVLALASTAVFVATHYVVSYFKKRKLSKMHNISESYTYVEPKENRVLKAQFAHGFAAVAVLLVSLFMITRAGNIQAATGYGFISEVERGFVLDQNVFALGNEDHMTITYIRVNYTAGATNETPTTNACGAVTEWRVEYFTNTELSGSPTLCRNEPNLNNDWVFGPPAPGIPEDNFSIRYTGSYDFAAGTYNFAATADDGVRLSIDGVRLIDSWGLHWSETRTASRELSAGSHTIVMEYQELAGHASNSLSWTTAQPNTPTPVPAPTPAPTPSPTPTPSPAPAPTPTLPQIRLPLVEQRYALIPPGPSHSFPGVTPPRHSIVSSGGSIGIFRHDCSYSHMNYDDAIVGPNQPGTAHMHTYFGNTASNASLDSNNIQNVGNSTCDGGTLNRTSYWMPSLIDGFGNAVRPARLNMYYKSGYHGVPAPQISNFLPQGLKIIAGNSGSTAPQGENFKWECRPRKGASGTESQSIPSCPIGYYLNANIQFPQCWNGQDRDSGNHSSHMAYGDPSSGCPSGYPVALPDIEYNIEFPVTSDTSRWRLSSDTHTSGPGGYSLHADIITGWDNPTSTKWLNNCTRVPGVDCGTSLISPTEHLIARPEADLY